MKNFLGVSLTVFMCAVMLLECGNTSRPKQIVNNAAVSSQKASYADNAQTGLPDNISTQVQTFRVNSNMPLYRCSATISDKDVKQTKKIEITDASSGTLIQAIVPTENDMATKSAAYFFDVTFDGNMDLLIPLERSAHYITFIAYLWDDTAKGFVEAPSFRNIWNPSICSDRKQILSKDSSSKITSYVMFAFDNNQFVATNSFRWQPAEHESNPVSNAENLEHCIEKKGDADHQTTVNDFYVPMVNGDININDTQLKPYLAPNSFWDLDSQKWQSTFYNELNVIFGS